MSIGNGSFYKIVDHELKSIWAHDNNRTLTFTPGNWIDDPLISSTHCVEIYNRGIHFCRKAVQCLKYCDWIGKRFLEVSLKNEGTGIPLMPDDENEQTGLCVAKAIKVEREICLTEWLEMCGLFSSCFAAVPLKDTDKKFDLIVVIPPTFPHLWIDRKRKNGTGYSIVFLYFKGFRLWRYTTYDTTDTQVETN